MRRTALVLLALVTVLAGACGGDEDPTVPPSPTEGNLVTEPPTTVAPPTDATPDDTDDAAVTDCSAAEIDLGDDFTENPDLTGQANETRRAIAQAAVDCDFDGLAALAGDEFTHSFGDSGDPAAHWRGLEDDGESVLEILVTLLRLDAHVEEPEDGQDPTAGTVYTWPRAYQGDDPAARQELEEAFGEEQVEQWYTPEGEYLGWRVGIRGDGAWIFYVAGD